MEYGLWRSEHDVMELIPVRLNPCSNGIWSLTPSGRDRVTVASCLNPCSNGIWSLTVMRQTPVMRPACLNPCSNGIWSLTRNSHRKKLRRCVLILVLMEYGLWLSAWYSKHWRIGLNPCSNGIWSLTQGRFFLLSNKIVLILVLMEYGLWPGTYGLTYSKVSVLILVLMEYGLWRAMSLDAWRMSHGS